MKTTMTGRGDDRRSQRRLGDLRRNVSATRPRRPRDSRVCRGKGMACGDAPCDARNVGVSLTCAGCSRSLRGSFQSRIG